MKRIFRNTYCAWLDDANDDDDEGDCISSSPLSPDKSCRQAARDQSSCKGSADLSRHLQFSLHLHSLIDDFLEPTSHPAASATSPFLPLHPAFNHNPYHKPHKTLIHELLQNVEEKFEDLRKEVMRCIKKADTHMQYSCANVPCSSGYSSYECLHVLVLEHLRKVGFNAGICKSRRDAQKNPHEGLFPTEEYEFMDVIVAEKGTHAQACERVIIDPRFKSHFEIARPSTAYMDLLKVVPAVYVGTPRVLRKILRLLSEAMKRSLESQGMALPPWRRLSFLHSKWLSPTYSRSISAPPFTNLNHTNKKFSTKREHLSCSTHKSPSPSSKRECSHCMIDNPTCGVTKPSPLVDIKHKSLSPFTSKREYCSHCISNNPTRGIEPSLLVGIKHNSTKRENSHSIISNPPPPFAKPPLLVDSKRVLKSCNSTSHTPRSGSFNKQLSIQTGEPMKVPWQLPPLSNPPSSLKESKRLVGALAIALEYASDSSTIRCPLSSPQVQLSMKFS